MCKFILKKRDHSSRLGRIKDIIIDNITAHPMGTSTITGHTDQPLENIRISNVHISMLPENAKDKRASDALRIEQVNGLKIRDLRVEWNEPDTEKKWESALVMKNVSDFVIDSFMGRPGQKGGKFPAVLMEDVSEGIMRESQAVDGTATFLHIKGVHTKGIILRNNYLKKAVTAVTFENNTLKKSVEML
jgi:hypothetical protein